MYLFTAFYADLPDAPSRANEFLRLMLAGERALKITNPGARYVALTDRRTAPLLEREIEIAVTAPDEAPLMIKALRAQIEFERGCKEEMSILAAPDCIAGRDLSPAMPLADGFGITYVGGRWAVHRRLKINNVGYARDHERAAWFLARALAILESWPANKQQWRGDQESWHAALDEVIDGGDTPTAFADGREIALYPTTTHNCFVPHGGHRKRSHADAYLLHFKGERKTFLEGYVDAHLFEDRGRSMWDSTMFTPMADAPIIVSLRPDGGHLFVQRYSYVVLPRVAG